MREVVAADVSWRGWERLGADGPRFDKRGYGAGGIAVSIVVQNLQGSSGTMIGTRIVDARGGGCRCEWVMTGGLGS